MHFARVTSVLFAFLTFGLFAAANPVRVLSKRDASCLGAINTLNSTVAGVAARFLPITVNTPDNKEFSIGLIGEIVEAIELASFVSNAIPPTSDQTGSTDNPIADALGEVIGGIVTVFKAMVELIPDLKDNIADADTEMTELVNILDLLISDFTNILSVFVSQLANLFEVAGLTELAKLFGFVAAETSQQ
ncbi:hypothetical protein SCHPADRAFT_890766 [Schizopora paradoxa]|uniref:Uncharacterized protein n=1 Tax=Schizopora paradoxa TaxID=27342 RepID=A0A0H2S6K5_9AGAM|nr:hypothetical protein SCHPADRAFT_890766 [Schizopora paradoxa]